MDELPDLIDSCHNLNADLIASCPPLVKEKETPISSCIPSSSSQIFRINRGSSKVPDTRNTPNGSSHIDNDERPEKLYSDDDSDDECDFEDKESDEFDMIGNVATLCLICSDKLDNSIAAINHMKQLHSFDLIRVCLTNKLDQIGFIKLINYLRTHKENVDKVKANDYKLEELEDEYMQPYDADDALLVFDIEGYMEDLEESGEITDISASVVDTKKGEAEVDELRALVKVQREMLLRLRDDMLKGTTVSIKESASDFKEGEDAGYFDSYSSYEIHQEMLQDKVRSDSYRDAILNNTSTLKGSRVLDVGCGTGILSMFCAKAGAKQVTGVDLATVAYDAMEIVRTNKLDDIVTIRHGRLESQSFEEKFDVIVSEWMGYFLLFEGMLDSVIYARDRFLKKGGTLLPNRCTMHIAAIDDKESYDCKHSFWSDVYGFDMSTISNKYIKSATTEIVKEELIATSTAQIKELNMNSCRVEDTNFKSTFSLTAKRDSSITAFCGYFDTFFDLLDERVMFSTGPQATPTHWKQTLFYLPQPIPLLEGEILTATITVKKLKSYARGLAVSYEVNGKTFDYTVD